MPGQPKSTTGRLANALGRNCSSRYLNTVMRLDTMTSSPPSRTHLAAAGCFAAKVFQKFIGQYRTMQASTMKPLKTPPKLEYRFARMIVRFLAQLEADGCFFARKSSGLAFHCKQNEPSSSLFLPKFPLCFLASCRNRRILKSFC